MMTFPAAFANLSSQKTGLDRGTLCINDSLTDISQLRPGKKLSGHQPARQHKVNDTQKGRCMTLKKFDIDEYIAQEERVK